VPGSRDARNWRQVLQLTEDEPRFAIVACEAGSRTLRYLTALLAKEIVRHSFPHPQHAAVLERMVEVLTITERRLER
jgi:hypothetical protein